MSTELLDVPRRCLSSPIEGPRVHPILGVALSCLGSWGGQCKNFINDVIGDAYAGQVYLGGGYFSDFLRAGAVPVQGVHARPGDVIQLNGPDHDRYYRGMHSAIVVGGSGPGIYRVLDSNFHWDETVTCHTWGPALQARRWDLSVWVWRFPLAVDVTTFGRRRAGVGSG